MNKLIKNQFGFSLGEIVIALGLMGVVGLVVSGLMKQSSDLKREAQSDAAIDQAFNSIQSIISYSELNNYCETSLGGVLSNPTLVASDGTKSFRAGDPINPTTSIQSISSTPTSASGKTRVLIRVVFLKEMPNGTSKSIEKSFVRPVVFSGGNLSCLSVDNNQVEAEALESVCNEVGGTVDTSTGSCDFDATAIDPNLEERMKRFACSMFGDINNYTAGVCSQIEVSEAIAGENISPSQLCINGGDCRQAFESEACQSGEFLTGVTPSGYRNCSAVNFVGQGDACIPSCACAATTPVGQTCDNGCEGTCAGTQPVCAPDCSCASSVNANSTCDDGCEGRCSGVRCDFRDTYISSGGACTFRNYASTTTTPGTCTNFTDEPREPPVCHELTGGCSGTTPPTFTALADGTECGTNKECQSGSCVNGEPGPTSCTLPATFVFDGSSGSIQCPQRNIQLQKTGTKTEINIGERATYGDMGRSSSPSEIDIRASGIVECSSSGNLVAQPPSCARVCYETDPFGKAIRVICD